MVLDLATVAQYTSGRLDEDADETQRLLSAGLAAARRFCGWHVAPLIVGDEITVDGPGGKLLVLPTLRLAALTAVAEDNVVLDLDMVEWSRRGLVRKLSGSWPTRYGSITVTMSHGFDDADDFNAAVLSFIDRASMAAVGGRPNVIGPVQWPVEALANGSAFTFAERSLLAQYRLESPA